ncbi:DUF4347 domain-containing protein [Dyella ginsengisoli]|uniref:DUF4347 domain-containing protein n=1 Tax=Dyella ginsengisoli TaxID=363848 RepID=A0ABW8JYN1_9GAMM
MAWWKRSKPVRTPVENVRAPARRPLAMALEPRVMFDGAVAATAAQLPHGPEPAVAAGPHALAAERAEFRFAPAGLRPDMLATRPIAEHDIAPLAASSAGRDVLFIDARVKDADSLLTHVAAGTQVVFLQQGVDGLQQMADYLDAHPGARSVQIITHGNDGDLWLGSTYLSADNVGQHADALARIGADMQAGGDILIYACDTAAGAKGLSFVDSLASLTHRDVAASSNRVGAGYDWNLEVTTGSIEARPVLSAVDEAGYTHDLATITVTSNADSGAGTLRQAIIDASTSVSDTITFSSSMTINLSTITSGNSLLVVSKNLTIEGDIDGNGTPDVTLNGQYLGRVLEITSGSNVHLDGLVIEHGLVYGNGGNATSTSLSVLNGGDALGGGIFNAGTLTLSNSTVSGNRAAGGGGASYTNSNPASPGTFYGFGGGGGGGYSGRGGGSGGLASTSFTPGAPRTFGGSGTGGNGAEGFNNTSGAHFYGGGGGGATAGIGGYQGSSFGGGSGGSAGGIGGGGGGWGNSGGVSGKGGDAAGGIYNSGALTVLHTTISNNAAAGGGGAGCSYRGGAYVAGAGGVAAGGILNRGTLQIDASTANGFTGNAAQGGQRGENGASDPSRPLASSSANSYADSGGTQVTLPSVSSVSAITANGTYSPGDVISITVSFNQAVTVTGTPLLTLETGTVDHTASYSSGGGSNVLTFTYTVQSGDTSSDLDYVSSSSLNLNGGTIKDSAGGTHDASLALPTPGATGSLAANKDIVIVPDLAPVVANLNGDSVSYTEGGSAVFIDSGSNATVTDSDNANFSGGNVTVTIVTNRVSAEDVLGIQNQGTGAGQIGVSGSNVTYGGVTIGTFTGGTGTSDLVISLNASATPTATTALVHALTYTDSNSTDPATAARTVRVTVNDGSGGTSTASDVTVSVIGVNDAPTISATGGTPTYTENGAAVDLFSGVSISTVEAGQTVKALTFTVSNVSDGSNEILAIDGSNVALTNGNSLTTATNGMTVTVSVVGSTATVSVSKGVGISSAAAQTLVDGMTYLDAGNAPTAGNRVVTLTSIQDNGGTANGGVDTTATSIAATVTVVAVNDAPVTTASGGSAAFVAGDNVASTPVVVDGGLTVTDADNATLASATVAVTGNFHSGEDVLSFTNDSATMGNIAASYNAATGVLTLTSAGATATLAQWQSALRSVTYTDTAITPNAATRTISFSASDGTDSSVAAARTVTVTATDQTPIATTSGGTTAFTEGNNVASTPVNVDGAITLSDLDNTTLASATVSVTGNFHSAEDVLAFTNDGATMGNIAASYNSATGVLTLTSSGATATLAQWQAALRAVTYTNASDTPNTANRSISFAVNDGSKSSAAASKTISVTSVDDTPIATTSGGTTSFTEGNNVTSTPVAIDGGLTVTDADNTTLASATVAITGNFHSGEDLLAFANDGATMGNIAASYNAATGVLTLSSAGATATLAQWQSALRSVSYTDTSDAPNTASRTISFTANDGSVDSAVATKVVSVTAVDDTPVATTSGGTTAFTEGNNVTSTPVAIDGGFTVSDLDNTTLASATVSITGNFHSGEDLLAFANDGSTMGNVTASYNAATGVLTLTSAGGTATLAQWQSALRSVTYTNGSELPNTATRTISYVVNDGTVDSGASTKLVSVASINDAPINGVPAGQSLNQDSSLAFNSGNGNLVAVSDADANGGIEQVTLTVTHGALSLSGTTGLSFLVGSGSGDATMTFQGTLADINAALNGMVYTPTAGYHGVDGLQITTSDLGNTGSGGAQTDTDTVAITVNSINPRVTDVSSTSADGGYKVGDTIYETVTFDQVVTVDTSGGAPTLLLETGTIDHNASYVSGSGTNTLTFAYTVQAGDASADLDYASTAALALNGAVIRNGSGDSAILTLPTTGSAQSIAGQKAIVVDGVAPAVTSVSAPANGTYVAGQNLDFTVNFSEAVVVDTAGGTPRLAVTLDTGGTVYADYVSGSGSTALVFRLTVTTGENDATGIQVGATLDANGGAVRDAVGNDAASALNAVASTAAVNVDAIAPSPTAIVRTNPSPTNAGGVDYTVTFSEDVTGVDVTDFTLASTATAAGSIASVTQVDGHTYTVHVGTISGTGTLQLNLNASGTGIADAAGNAITGGLAGASYSVDRDAPTITSVSVPANGTYVAGQNLDFVVHYSESVTVDTTAGTPRLAVTLDTGGTVYADYVSGSGTSALVFRLAVTAGQADPNGIALGGTIQLNGGAIHDVAGNSEVDTLNSVASTAGVRIDAIAPIASIALSDTALKAGETSQVTITFSEAVSGLTTADFSVANGTLGGLSSADGGVTWTATFTPSANVTAAGNRITLDNAGVNDAAGNTGLGTTASAAFAIDTQAPQVVSIARNDAAITSGQQGVAYTITFSEDVSGLTAGDLQLVLGGNAKASIDSLVAVDGHTYVVTLGGVAGNGTLRLDLAAANSGIADLAGNALSSNAQGEVYTIGGVAPVILPVASVTPLGLPTLAPAPDAFSPLSPDVLPTIYFRDAAPMTSPALLTGGGFDGLPLSLSSRASFADQVRDGLVLPSSLEITPGRPFVVALPGMPGRGGVVQVQQADGRPLPGWLRFDPAAGTLEGRAPAGLHGRIALQVLVIDADGRVHTTVVELDLSARDTRGAATGSPDRRTTADTPRAVTAGKPALQAQFGQQRHAGHADHAALLHQLAVAQRHQPAPVTP